MRSGILQQHILAYVFFGPVFNLTQGLRLKSSNFKKYYTLWK